MWSRAFAKAKDHLRPDLMLVVEGFAEPQGDDSRYGAAKLFAEKIWPLEDELEDYVRSVTAKVPLEKLAPFSELMERSGLASASPERPSFYVSLSDGLTGTAVFCLAKSPRLTLGFLAEGSKILGERSFSFSDDASPPRG